VKEAASSHHSRREWMYLAERVFSHPRYSLLIVAALALSSFERLWFVIAPLTLFFSVELVLRLWLQKEQGWRDRNEMIFIVFDALATIGLYLILFAPVGLVGNSIYLRMARLLRGMYMLRMMRVFHFVTYESFIYSLPMAVMALGLCAVALGMESIAPYMAIALLVELAARLVAIGKVLPGGKRRKAEYCFIAFDLVTTLALFNMIEGVPMAVALLRAVRVLVMLNPLGSLVLAARQVAMMPEVRKESGMLVSMLVILMFFSALMVYFIYPHMDLSGDGLINSDDYNPLQVAMFAFIWLVDPGTTPEQAFSPGLSLLTIGIALTGVFFFALLVGLGANVMGALLRELTNSPLSSRVQLVFSGDNEKAEGILKVFGEMCSRMRRAYFSAWIFFDHKERVISGFGSWLNIRQTDEGSRQVLSHFNLNGIKEIFFFHKGYADPESIVDHHALVQEARLKKMDIGVSLLSESGVSRNLESVYHQTLDAEVFNSAAITARMLYQMHHCPFMPELGSQMLDAVEGDTGLFTVSWQARIVPGNSGSKLVAGNTEAPLVDWATNLFASGVNALAFRSKEGDYRLLSDMVKISRPFEIEDVIAMGREASLWPGMMEQAVDKGIPPIRNKVIRMFEWPETWDLNLLFMGWHDGLPSMIEEMAEKHHKLTLNVLNPSSEKMVRYHQMRLDAVGEKVKALNCDLKVQIHPWDGLDISEVTPLLRNCKVIMLYPVEREDDSEDSLLEMWYHSLARLLSARKQEVKWWTPPKIMILPRNRVNSESFVKSTESYPLLKIDIGSPDSFHDVYMARKILSFANRSRDSKGFEQESKTFEFMDMMLGDAVLVEGENTNSLLEQKDATWEEVYREGLRRGWVPVAYGLESSKATHLNLYRVIDHLFPIQWSVAGEQLHLLAGTLIDEFEMPSSSSVTLFCRRGIILKEEKVVTTEPAAAEVAEVHVAEAAVQPAATEVAETEVAETEVAEAEVAEAEVAETEVAETEVAETEVAETEVAETEVAETEVAETEVAETEAAVAEVAEAEVAEAEAAVTEAVAEVEVAQSEVAVTEPVEAQETEMQEEQNSGLATIALEGEVMAEIWPKSADPKLLRVLMRQLEGSLQLLNESTENGLMKLSEVLEKNAGTEVEEDIMLALTELQNIDRVMQRMNNVKSCLDEWSQAVKEQDTSEAMWKESVSGRYVMEEERLVLRDEL